MRWGFAICVVLLGCTENGTTAPREDRPPVSVYYVAPEPVESGLDAAKSFAVEAEDAQAPDPIASHPDGQISIAIEPADAEVYENGAKVCSRSPCGITYGGRDADPAKRHKLYISRGDLCDAETRTVRLGDRLHVTLKCLPPTELNDIRLLPY
jgi:hypothetical protein